MCTTFLEARKTAVDYARRDNQMWHVLDNGEGYSVVSDMDRKYWYADKLMMFTADPIFLRKVVV